jgi:hypothetical protein
MEEIYIKVVYREQEISAGGHVNYKGNMDEHNTIYVIQKGEQ